MESLEQAIIDALNLFPEVMWDRFVDEADHYNFVAYGWLNRPQDLYKDFMVVEFDTDTGAYFFITSSAYYSKTFSERLGNDGHVDCQRIEHSFPAVKNKVTL